MISKKEQIQFSTVVKTQFTATELEWINTKINLVSSIENSKKFTVFFSLVSRFISNNPCCWNLEHIDILERILPGFGKTTWTKQDIARVLLMISLDNSINKSIVVSFFEIAEIKEQIALYKGLFLLENASEFKNQVAEGIRTNMVNVFEAIAFGNPFPKTYLSEEEWNQLILKCFFLDLNLYNIQYIDKGKNNNLAKMLQDYVKERWAAGRNVSFEIWRMIDGYLRDDVAELIATKQFTGLEKEIIHKITEQKNLLTPNFWDTIGKQN